MEFWLLRYESHFHMLTGAGKLISDHIDQNPMDREETVCKAKEMLCAEEAHHADKISS